LNQHIPKNALIYEKFCNPEPHWVPAADWDHARRPPLYYHTLKAFKKLHKILAKVNTYVPKNLVPFLFVCTPPLAGLASALR